MRIVSRYLLLALVAFVMIFPFLWMVANSFSSKQGIFSIPPNLIPDRLFEPQLFSNYIEVFGEFNFGRYMWNSLYVSGLASVGQVITCATAGFALGKMRFPGRNLVFALILATMMIPIHATIIPEYLLMNRLGWLNSYAPLIVPSFLIGTFGTFLFKVFFENAPMSLLEAAVIDGASPGQLFVRVFLPLARGAVVTLFIIAFMNNWNDLLRPVLYISDRELMTSTQALTQFQSQYSADWNLLLTAAVVSTAPLLLLYGFLQRYIIEGVARLGIKG
ncbi:MAG: ABC transporter permease subunit [Spirochaetes bacterium]|jgi:multiple sugar transport system permease protein|nr:ABC transporter permease subunit [Spirochaetota bacterium]